MNRPVIRVNDRAKTVVVCEGCSQKIRIPRSHKKLRVTCPTCRHTFTYRYYAAGLSSYHLKSLLVGLAGAGLGFVAGELALTSQFAHANELLAVLAVSAVFGASLGAVLDGAEGFLRRNRARAWYALESGAPTGMVAAIIAGLIAQLIYSGIYTSVVPGYHTGEWLVASRTFDPPFPRLLVARMLGWCAMGVGMAAVYGIAAKKWKIARTALIGGAIGGAVGGLLFELARLITQLGGGTLSRLLGFAALGAGLGLALFRPRMAAVQRKLAAARRGSTGPVGDWTIVGGIGLTIVGLAITVAGAYLYVGNTTGRNPTFPYSGCLTLNIGALPLVMGLVAIKMWFTERS